MKRSFTDPGVVFTYAFYAASQTLLLKPFSGVTQSVILALMGATVFRMCNRHTTQWRATFDRPQVLVIGLSVVMTYGLFSEPVDLLVVLVKVMYVLAVAALLESPVGVRTLVKAADWTLATVFSIAIAAQVGLLPTMATDEHWDGLAKNYAGFTNPNAPMLFVFGSMALYFLLGCRRRFISATLAALVLFEIGAVSRTYFGACVLLVAVAILSHRPALRTLLRYGMLPVFSLLYFIGSTFIVMAAITPEVLVELVGSQIDLLLSLRLETALLYLYEPGHTLTGVRFAALDSIYFELVLVLGPFFWFLVLRGAYRCWRAARRSDTEFRLLSVVTIVSATGLLETALLSLTLVAVLLFFIATRRRDLPAVLGPLVVTTAKTDRAPRTIAPERAAGTTVE